MKIMNKRFNLFVFTALLSFGICLAQPEKPVVAVDFKPSVSKPARKGVPSG